MKKKIFLILMMLILSTSVFALSPKADGGIFREWGGVTVDWEHTLNSKDKQEFIITIDSSIGNIVEPSLILSEYTKGYSDLTLDDVKLYLYEETFRTESKAEWCSDETYMFCSETQSENNSMIHNYIVDVVDVSEFDIPLHLKSNSDYFEVGVDSLQHTGVNKNRKYKLVLNPNNDFNVGDYGVFSLLIDNFEFWDKTHSSDFLILNMDAFYPMTTNCTENIYGEDGLNNGASFINNTHGCDFESSEVDYINITNIMGAYLNNPFTFCTWVQQESYGTPREMVSITNGFPYDGNGDHDSIMHLGTNVGKFAMSSYQHAGSGGTGGSQYAQGLTDITSDFSNWYHLCGAFAPNDLRIWVNGINEANTTTTNTGYSYTAMLIGAGGYRGGFIEAFDGNLMGVGVWDEVLTTNDVNILYEGGREFNPLSTGSEPINITFVSQQPNDLDFQTIFEDVNITYEVTNHNTSEDVYINYTLFDPIHSCDVSINNTCIEYPQTKTYASNVGDNYVFNLDKFEIVPSIYSIDPNYLYSVVGNNLSLDSDNDRIKIDFGNFKNDTIFNQFEIDLISPEEQSLEIFYCNSTYIDGLITIDNIPFGCGILGQIETTGSYNHTHDDFGGSQTVDFTISNGLIGDVRVTNVSSIIIRGETSNEMILRYVENNTYSAEYSGNRGVSYSPFVGTIDAHLHQFSGDEILNYSVCATNLTGSIVCNDAQSDPYGDLPSFEELPFVRVTNPADGSTYNINDDLIIRWIGFDGDGDTLTYNLDVDGVQVLTATTNLSYNIDLSAYSGVVPITIEVCEQGSIIRCSDDTISFNVTTTVTTGGIDFNWNVDNPEPEFLGCPTNFMQFLILILFYVVSVAMVMIAYRVKQPFFMFAGCSGWIFTSLFFWSCAELLSLMLVLMGVGGIILMLTAKIYPNDD